MKNDMDKLSERLTLRNGDHVQVRPIRPEDEAAHQEFFSHLTPRDVYFRFFGFLKGFSHEEMTRYTNIDYEHDMAFIAVGETGETAGRTVGVVRAVGDPSDQEAEFAIVIRSDLAGTGLGYGLTQKIIRYAKSRGWKALNGQVLADNRRMLTLAADVGFKRVGMPESGVVHLRLDLSDKDSNT